MVRVWAERKLPWSFGVSPPVLLPALKTFYFARNKSPLSPLRFSPAANVSVYSDSNGDRDVPGLVQFPAGEFSRVEGKIIHFPLSTDASMLYGSFSTKTV